MPENPEGASHGECDRAMNSQILQIPCPLSPLASASADCEAAALGEPCRDAPASCPADDPLLLAALDACCSRSSALVCSARRPFLSSSSDLSVTSTFLLDILAESYSTMEGANATQ